MTKSRHVAARALRLLPAALLLTLACAASVWAQTSVTDGKTPSGLAPGSPASSYALSGFETVNLYNGGLSFRLPLKGVGGRGSAGYTVTLPVEQKWIVKAGKTDPNGTTPLTASPNWWQGNKPGYGPGVMHGRRASHVDDTIYDEFGCDTDIDPACPKIVREANVRTLTRLTFTGADGTEYELRDRDTGGQPKVATWTSQTGMGNRDGFSRGTVFVTADGTSATFISDEAVLDYIAITMPLDQKLFKPSGVLLLADGTRYRVVKGLVTSITDRNGNLVTFAYVGSRVTAATDQLGRQVTFTYDDGVRHYDEIAYKGFGGAARRVRVWYASLESRLRPNSGYELKDPADLFSLNSATTETDYNPQRVSEVELPDGRRYQLYYNPYGELARVELPTGGAFEYDWDGGASAADAVIFRYVTERRVYPSGGAALEHRVRYTRAADGADSTVEVRATDASGALLTLSRHHFHGDAFESLVEDPARPGAVSYGKWREGKEYKAEELASDGETVLRRVEQTWAQRAPVPWWTQGADSEPPNDPRLTQTVTTLVDTGHVSKQSYAYDQFNNRTDTYDYDYGAGAPGGLTRRTHTDYMTELSYVDAAVNPTDGAHLRSLPSLTWVSSDAAGNAKVSRTAYEYDNYSDDARHKPLETRTGITGHDTATYPAGFTRRGNVTGVTSYADATAQTGAVTVSTQYDVAGNPVRSIDARGHLSSVAYENSFCNGAGLGCGGSFTANTYAFPTSTTSPIPDATNTYGSSTALTTATKYDFWTGLAYSTKDANDKPTTYSYVGPLDRLTAVVRPDDSRTDYEYGDTPGNLYVRTQADLDATRRTDSYQYFDRLGRPYRSISYENQDAAKQWVTVDTEYDALGRVRRASLPYRAAAGAAMFSTDRWIETAYDALGRVTSVTTRPDNAAVTTSYSGNQVTVTDQAGKKRRSVTDALGRLVRVDEPSASGSLGTADAPIQPTHYSYDAVGNLRKVTQGTQARFFMYDSLGRLTRAKNPEQAANASITGTDPLTNNSQWSLSYSYDAAGNLLTRTDARNVTTTYGYDPLGRNTSVSYSDATMGVGRAYDKAANGRGRLAWDWQCRDSQNCGTHSSYSYDAAGRVTVRNQHFWAGGAWGASYSTSYVYNKAGNVTSMTYPSGRTASYAYNLAGRLVSFDGNLGDGVQRTYSDGIDYDEMGGMRQERFGTQTPLYHKRAYNARGQLSHIRLSTYSALDSDPAKRDDYNRGMIVNSYGLPAPDGTEDMTVNNGNLRRQTVHAPSASGGRVGTFFYEYDSLNRLDYVREAVGGADLWKQDYDYDRWGNRTVNAANTQVYGTSPAYSIPEPQFDTDNLQYSNRLYAPGDLALPAGSRRMAYDAAGNLTNDTHTGQGTRTYDAENRMTSAQFLSGQIQTAAYTYDADGRRVKRDMGAAGETWQVYGMGGELLAEYAAEAAPTQPQVEYGYRAGELLVKAAAPVGQALATPNAAAFVRADTTTQGDWKGAYGADGYNVIGDTASYPAYAQVSITGHTANTWAPSTSDARALRKAGSSTDRVAACWYSATSFTVDVNLTDGRAHRVALYNLDWSGTATRAQRVEVLDGATGVVLDARDLTAFRNPGVYLVWHVSGRVKFRVTYAGATAWNAVVSGLFFDPMENASALFEGEDAATQGDWKGAYGADGYNVINHAVSYPTYAQVSVAGQSSYTWAASSTETRALQKASGSGRIAATWYSATSLTVDVNLTDGQEHRVALYCLDWGNNGRTQRVEVLDAATGAVLDSRSVSSFVNGKYVAWRLKGHVRLRVVNLNPATNAAVSGLFFGGRAGDSDLRWMVADHLGTAEDGGRPDGRPGRGDEARLSPVR